MQKIKITIVFSKNAQFLELLESQNELWWINLIYQCFQFLFKVKKKQEPSS